MHLQASDNVALMEDDLLLLLLLLLYYIINITIIAIKIDPFCFYCGCTVLVRISTRDLVYASGASLWFYSVSPDKQ